MPDLCISNAFLVIKNPILNVDKTHHVSYIDIPDTEIASLPSLIASQRCFGAVVVLIPSTRSTGTSP